MQVPHHFLRITRIYAVTRRPHHGPVQSPDYPRLAWTPKVKDVQSFLSFAKFYCHFIYGYSEITIPLVHLTCKGALWNFSDECHSAFEALKKAFTTAFVLTHWILITQITVKTNASDYALTAVLSIIWMVNCTPLHSTPRHFLLWNSNKMCTTKNSWWFLKLSNDGDITLKDLHSWSMWPLITGICNNFQWPKSLHINKHIGTNISLVSTL